MPPETGPDFMDKYNLHKTPEVEKSVRKLRGEGEKFPDKRESLVDAHFRRIDRALGGKRNMFTHLVRDKLFNEYTINLHNEDGSENKERIDKLVQGLFDSEKEILHQRGMSGELEEYGDTPKPEDYEKYKQQIYDKKREQEKTLGKWIDYLGSEEANFYPTWFKYLALRSLQKMGKRDRDAEYYTKRSNNTLQPFPDLSREALAKTLTALKQDETTDIADTDAGEQAEEMLDEEKQAKAELNQMIEKGNFAKLYAHFQGEIERDRRERGESTAGEWRHFPAGSNAEELVSTLEGKGTEWCTVGLDVARGQLKAGEFWIYYTYDKAKKPADPRVAVYLINGEISEVRGIYGKDQDLELDFVDIAREKYKDFPGSESYEKKDKDMKNLSKIEKSFNKESSQWIRELSQGELIFLYEINSTIEGFGHGADPRVAELRSQRDPKEDAPVMLECEPHEIAWNQNEINQTTKAYIGDLFPGIFQLAQLEHIYTSFPEGRVKKSELIIGGKTKEELVQALRENNIKISDYAKDMLNNPDFITQPNPEQINLVRLSVSALGFQNSATVAEIYQRAEELGLNLCPAEVGPYQRLEDKDQPLNRWYWVAMKQITDRNGYALVFFLNRYDSGLWLINSWANPDYRWNPSYEFMFRLRQVSLDA